ncbi:hypothetical protein AQ490_19890 [Wenjunlia vitaminophila]|uniref:Pycsar effector protein domain-containing protein n=1 Tax=Wenjunlia vitaminophila TaxID=76728 RepID=A0A0T6LUT7_WENVI|nr:Pycsar system effector family protein [Wenjunlia vitaminophila]KRV49586.1 hypothetical protein AQ490_19890 [Wenjunlia vitaminophila]
MTAGTGPGPADPDLRFIADRVLTSVREDLGRADAKAAILLSGAMAFAAVLVSGDRDALLSRFGSATGPGAVWLTLGGVLWASGVVMLAAVLFPRTWVAADSTFLRDVSHGASPDELLVRLADSRQDVVQWTLAQVCAMGAILARKYRWLRLGTFSLGLGGLFALLGEVC